MRKIALVTIILILGALLAGRAHGEEAEAEVGDKLIDGSVRTRLQDLRKGLIEAGLEVRI